MKLTKEVRHKIYVKALRKYVDLAEHTDVRVGLCGLMAYINGGYAAITDFPEIMRNKPQYEDIGEDAYWWDVNDTATRIRVLQNAVELTL